VIASKLPRRLAVSGILIGFAFMAVYWLDYKYNFSHIPTSAETQVHSGLQAPAWYIVADKLMVILCPGLLLQTIPVDGGISFALVLWVLAALLNGPIYYCIGLILVSLIKRRNRVPAG
jgi:hypothetical protein